ncbi:prolipoprotein diacylglyceryl transferase [Antribacter soli]
MRTTLTTGIPSPPLEWSAIHLGPLTIHVYALCLLAGMAAAVVITQRRLSPRGGPDGVVIDIAIWAIPLGLVGARIYHVLTHPDDYFYAGADLWDVVRIWDGGNALYGSLIGGAVGAWIGCRRAGIRLASFADALAPGLLVAQAVGRLGNYVNQELFGRPTTLPWGLEIDANAPMFPDDTPAGTVFHPLFLYEMVWNVAGAMVLLALDRRFGLRWGRLFGLYLVWYGLGRSWLELIRIDPTSGSWLGIPANLWTSVLVITLGLVIFLVQGRRHPEPEGSVHLPGREPVPGPERSDDAEAPATDS